MSEIVRLTEEISRMLDEMSRENDRRGKLRRIRASFRAESEPRGLPWKQANQEWEVEQ